MKARDGKPVLEMAIQVPREIEGVTGSALRDFVPSLMWRAERRESGVSLLKSTLVIDDRVDRIISEIEEALQRIEARKLLSEPIPVDLRVLQDDQSTSRRHGEFQPRKVSPRLALAPPYEPVQHGQGQQILLIDPQDAFGDGNHPSTRLALLLLDELLSGQHGAPPEGKGWVLDAGCGSGVLALGAAALSDFRVLAVDLDPRAIDAARGNLRLNRGPGSQVVLALGELSCVRGPFCLVLANLVPTLHVRAYGTLWRALAPGGWLILSGFCQTHKDSILRPYLRNGAAERACSVDQAWAGALLQKQGKQA